MVGPRVSNHPSGAARLVRRPQSSSSTITFVIPVVRALFCARRYRAVGSSDFAGSARVGSVRSLAIMRWFEGAIKPVSSGTAVTGISFVLGRRARLRSRHRNVSPDWSSGTAASGCFGDPRIVHVYPAGVRSAGLTGVVSPAFGEATHGIIPALSGRVRRDQPGARSDVVRDRACPRATGPSGGGGSVAGRLVGPIGEQLGPLLFEELSAGGVAGVLEPR